MPNRNKPVPHELHVEGDGGENKHAWSTSSDDVGTIPSPSADVISRLDGALLNVPSL